MASNALYTPPAGLHTVMDEFRDYVGFQYGISLTTYDDLHNFSISRLNDFWMSVWKYAGIKASFCPEKINQFPAFFEVAKLNFAENILCRKWNSNDLAMIDFGEHNLWSPDKYTWQDLKEMVENFADALKNSDLQRGEVVALIGSNCARSLALLLATAALGCVFSSFATDVGERALEDRLDQLRPRILIIESAYSYNGTQHDVSHKIKPTIFQTGGINSCELVIIGDLNDVEYPCTSFDDFLGRATGTRLVYEQVPFNTPLVVMFSSGTTGTPKGILHSHGGLVLNGVKEHLFHNNFGAEDVYFHFTNIGWTLWNVAIGSLFCGTTLVLYDGSPFYPTPEGFLRAVFANGVTAFGAGPRYYLELQKQNLKPKIFAPKLDKIFSTGAVLTAPLASWLADAFGPVCQISFSGGTELCGSFVHGTPSLPSYPGEISVKALGMDIEVFSPQGKPLKNGESGELVCLKPFPNMPVMFLNDLGKSRYYDAYFTGFPHVWTHGDFIKINPETRGIYILGRSDGVLNPSGVRFGSSEIYNILSTDRFTSSITDALVVGQQRTSPYFDTTERILLFIKCSPIVTTNTILPCPRLEADIRKQISKDLSRRHVPEYIFEMLEVPYNANGKKLEIQVKAVVTGGSEARQKLTVTEEEMRSLERFDCFYEIERLEAVLKRGGTKL